MAVGGGISSAVHTGTRQTLSLAPAAAAQSRGLVVPRCVFAAGRQRFDCFVRGTEDTDEAIACMFVMLPLREHGWDRMAMKVMRLYAEHDGAVFRVERCE